MKIGKITSIVGNEIVASAYVTRKPLDLKLAKTLQNKPVFLEDSRDAKALGRITNVIGNVDEPYYVIGQPKGSKIKPAEKLINKNIYAQLKLDI